MSLRLRCKAIFGSNIWAILSSSVTIYCLFGPDVNTICFTKSEAAVFDSLTLFSLIFFSTEMILTCIGDPHYPFSFFFFLDFVATATIPLDLSYVTASFMSSTVSNASKASRAGTRATRIIRILRLIRLFRISHLFKSVRKAKDEKVVEDDWSDTSSTHTHIDKQHIVESEVAKRLSDLAGKRVILLVLTMMFVVPQLDPAAQFTVYPALDQIGLDRLKLAYSNLVSLCEQGTLLPTMRKEYETRLLNYVGALSPSLAQSAPSYDMYAKNKIAWIILSAPNLDACMNGSNSPWLTLTDITDAPTGYTDVYARLRAVPPSSCGLGPVAILTSDSNCPSDLRPTDYSVLSSASDDGLEFAAFMDHRESNKADAFMSIYRTLVICGILAVGTFVFSNSAFSLVLEPIERMIHKVNQIRLNPLLATRMHDSSASRNEERKLRALAKFNTAGNFFSRWLAKRQLLKLFQTSMETEMLEKTIVRIGGLLAIGFGPAGADIVARNMSSMSAGLNVMLPGRKIEAIFGCIRIENFPMIAGVLKQRVMLFVNQISEIVHGITDEFHGIINRTDGGEFQVVWKLDANLTEHERKQVHDMAIAACVKIVIAIKRSLALEEYRNVPPIVMKIPNFRVKLSFGLHKGWAIEGAIGSVMKIDPSYLSADVNVAETVQKLNECYKTSSILLSDTVREGCSVGIQSLMRLVDRIHIQSRRRDLSIYSVDLNIDTDLLTRYEIENLLCTTQTSQTTNRSRLRSERETRKARKWRTDMLGFLQEDKYFHYLREIFESNPLFMETFRAGVLNIECGEWDIALRALRSCSENLMKVQEESESLSIYEDGVTSFLVNFLQMQTAVAPNDWTGSRYIM